MKILVVDDDVVARKVLTAFLKQSNYEMQIVEDGPSAFLAMTAPGAPLIALIDWVMPELDGAALCTKLRNHPFEIQPYLIMLSGRKEKAEIAQGLDLGADDFISKPFNIQETQARLRVATRSIERQLKLRQRIVELETSLQKQQLKPTASPMPAAVHEAPVVATNLSLVVATLEAAQIDDLVASALLRSGVYADPRRIRLALPPETATAAWGGLLLTREEIWVDLLLEVDAANLTLLFEQTRNRPASDARELADFSATLLTSLRNSIDSAMAANGYEVIAVAEPQATFWNRRSCPLLPKENIERHHYQIGGSTMTLVVITQKTPLKEKSVGQLNVFDVLAKPYPPADTHHVPLLNGGVILKENLIDKLREFTEASSRDVPPIAVYAPTNLALHYLMESDAGRPEV